MPHIDFVACKIGSAVVQHVQGRMSNPSKSTPVSSWHYDGTPIFKTINGKRHILVGRQLICVYGKMSIRTRHEFGEVIIAAGESHTFVGDCGLEVMHVAVADGSRAMLRVDHYAPCDHEVPTVYAEEAAFVTGHFTTLGEKVGAEESAEHCSSGAAAVEVRAHVFRAPHWQLTITLIRGGTFQN